MSKNVVSDKWSFSGYDWWYAVKDEVKEVLRIGIPLAVVWWATSNPAYIAIGTAAGAFALKAFEYFYKTF